jgi:hypothetical protein
VTKSDVRGLIPYNALQVTLTLNFGGDAVVPDTRGLNISSIYGSIYVYIYLHIILTIRQLVILYFNPRNGMILADERIFGWSLKPATRQWSNPFPWDQD